MLIVSNFLLWVVVLLQLVAIAALARRGRVMADSPQRMAAPDLAGPGLVEPLVAEGVAEPGEGGLATMILHIAAGCPVGQRLIPDAALMARTAGMRFQLARFGLAGGGATSPFAAPARGRGAARIAKGKEAGQLPPPHVMLVDAVGDVLAQGAAKSRPDLARLLARVSGDRPAVA